MHILLSDTLVISVVYSPRYGRWALRLVSCFRMALQEALQKVAFTTATFISEMHRLSVGEMKDSK